MEKDNIFDRDIEEYEEWFRTNDQLLKSEIEATPFGAQYEKNKHLYKSYRDANFHTVKEITKMLKIAGFTILEKNRRFFRWIITTKKYEIASEKEYLL